MKRIGLIAGSGQFPLLWARAAKQQGYEVVAIAHVGETGEELSTIVDKVVWVHLGELDKIIGSLKAWGITEAVLAGGIRKSRLFSDARPDRRAIALLMRVEARSALGGDDALLRALSDELAREGIAVQESTALLSSLLTPAGLLTGRPLTPDEEKDIRFGFRLAKELGRLEVGQCVVIKAQTVLAVEALEGTDETIRRAGRLSGPGAVVVKASKPQQDVRFDLPAVGPQTITVMAEVKAAVLALEAGSSIILEKERLVGLADTAGISVIGWPRE
jgi:DUF1009 family protein